MFKAFVLKKLGFLAIWGLGKRSYQIYFVQSRQMFTFKKIAKIRG